MACVAGDIEKDFWYAFDLLRSPKDHVEFTLVRDFVRDALAEVCSEVRVDTEKSVLKQAAVQHLYGRLSGQLQPHTNDAQLLVSLNPFNQLPILWAQAGSMVDMCTSTRCLIEH